LNKLSIHTVRVEEILAVGRVVGIEEIRAVGNAVGIEQRHRLAGSMSLGLGRRDRGRGWHDQDAGHNGACDEMTALDSHLRNSSDRMKIIVSG
jgi:hypothetical protein